MKTKPLQNDWQKHAQDKVPLFDKVRSRGHFKDLSFIFYLSTMPLDAL